MLSIFKVLMQVSLDQSVYVGSLIDNSLIDLLHETILNATFLSRDMIHHHNYNYGPDLLA